MRDEFSGSRLPDLPNAGYATTREKALSDVVMQFMRMVERQRLLLLKIVIDGPARWRHVARGKWAGSQVTDDLLNAMFGYFELLARDPNDPTNTPAKQYERLKGLAETPHWQRATWAQRLDPVEAERRIRDSRAFTEAIRSGSRHVRELKRRG